MILSKPGFALRLSIPDHKSLSPGLLRDQIRKAGLTFEQFAEALKH